MAMSTTKQPVKQTAQKQQQQKQQSSGSSKSGMTSNPATKIACTITNCTYNSSKCCDAKSIKVQGVQSAPTSSVSADSKQDTCCGTFKASK